MKKEKIQNDYNTPDGVEETIEEEILEPFNPQDIDIVSQPAVLGQLVDRIERRYASKPAAYICLDPDFQRSESIWKPIQKSRLIESVLLGIPLPMFYVSASPTGVWDVVDGIQRLGTFRDFMLGKKYLDSLEDNPDPRLKGVGFKLQNLEFLTQFNEKRFIDLPGKQQEDLKGCPLQVTVIRSGTPEAVKFNIFKRINTGGQPLTSQEIRHALHQGKATAFLKKLVECHEFIAATDASIKDRRMEGRELILRLLSSKILNWENLASSKINIEQMLNQTMRILNELGGTSEKTKEPMPIFDKSLTLDSLEEFFISAMQRNQELFGNYAFRKSLPGAERKTQINKALFEMWGVLLGSLTCQQWKTLILHKNNILMDCKTVYSNASYDFEKSVGPSANLTSMLKKRYEIFRNLLNKYLKEAGYDK